MPGTNAKVKTTLAGPLPSYRRKPVSRDIASDCVGLTLRILDSGLRRNDELLDG